MALVCRRRFERCLKLFDTVLPSKFFLPIKKLALKDATFDTMYEYIFEPTLSGLLVC